MVVLMIIMFLLLLRLRSIPSVPLIHANGIAIRVITRLKIDAGHGVGPSTVFMALSRIVAICYPSGMDSRQVLIVKIDLGLGKSMF